VEPEDTPGGGLTVVLTLPAAPARPAAARIAATNAVTVVLTFTTASQRDELMKER
jgi:hypothetical protein